MQQYRSKPIEVFLVGPSTESSSLYETGKRCCQEAKDKGLVLPKLLARDLFLFISPPVGQNGVLGDDKAIQKLS